MLSIEQAGKLFFAAFLGAIVGVCAGFLWFAVHAATLAVKGILQ
jgi:UDP-N-acetylmuramyl pentapeptide phosphotransferase/UDP-N-acetylglucosamine-1-phosphate transferase